MTRLLLCLLLLSAPALATRLAVPAEDSIGVERKNGRTYVLHRIEAGETLYAVARRYNATVTDLRDANPGTTGTLKVGQVLRVPLPEPVAPTSADARRHRVAAGQTLFAISRQYNVTVEELRRWNGLADNELAAGQTLVVSAPAADRPLDLTPAAPPPATDPTKAAPKYHRVRAGETLYAVAGEYGVEVADLRRWNGLQNNEIAAGQTLAVSAVASRATPTPPPAVTPPPRAAELRTATSTTTAPSAADKPAYEGQVTRRTVNVTGHDKVIEMGLAEVIDNIPETSKYLALHRTAPVGTILQIKNERNGRTVFVRVIGRLPDTGNTDKVVVRISQKAFDRLEARDRRFLVEVSYIP
ncbi:MAG: LysM peptidoglycan-binding domain-containing protein [Catalinimonas sp.]